MKNPAINWYFDNWFGGTMGMNRHQKGCYIDLLGLQFQLGHLSIEQIKNILGADFNQWNNLKVKFREDEEGNFFNERLETEILKRKSFSERGRKGGNPNLKKGISNPYYHNKDKLKDNLINKQKDKLSEIDIETDIGLEEKEGVGEKEGRDKFPFEDFWESYQKKRDTAKCIQKWKRLKDCEKEKIMQVVSDYVKSTPDPQYRKNPLTWLNGKCWNDQIKLVKTARHSKIPNNEW